MINTTVNNPVDGSGPDGPLPTQAPKLHIEDGGERGDLLPATFDLLQKKPDFLTFSLLDAGHGLNTNTIPMLRRGAPSVWSLGTWLAFTGRQLPIWNFSTTDTVSHIFALEVLY